MESNHAQSDGRAVRRVALASFIGTTIEWYDFFLSGAAAALVFDKLFFPNLDGWVATLASYGTYAVGFVARPIGGIVCGHYGDRIGRKSMLVLTLLLMGIATFLIGLLPTYEAIGPLAPVLLVLLRLLQGFGVGGEWGGAVLMAVEHAPKGRRGFYGSWPQIGVPAGMVLATGVFGLVSKLPNEQFLAWGWRACFLLSLLLVGVGFFIRRAVFESPAFARVKEEKAESKLPVVEAIRRHPRGVLLAMGARFAENGAFYIFSIFVLTYATKLAGFEKSTVLTAVTAGAFVELFTIPLFGALSDRYGRRPVYLFGALFTGLIALPVFWMVDQHSPALLVLALVLALAVGHAAMYGPQASFFSELFGTKVRYSGASLGYQLASVFAGGLSPFLASALLERYHAGWPIGLLLIGMALVTLASVFLATETAHRDVDEAVVAAGEAR